LYNQSIGWHVFISIIFFTNQNTQGCDVVELGLLINGKLISSNRTVDVTNPANGQKVGSVPCLTRDQVREAINSAQNAFKAWSKLTPGKRSKILRKASCIIRNSSEELATLLTKEHGKPLSDSRKEIDGSADVFEYYSQAVMDSIGEISCPGSSKSRSLVFKEPIGVVAAIASWNYPVSLIAWKIAPALAAGCTVLVKPPTATPLALARFIRLIADAGFPDGVLNVVYGSHSEVSDELICNPIVQKIAFTGSTETGKKIMESSAATLKKLNLELGGHSPLIVFEDANFKKAVKDGVKRSFRNMGQICNAVNRIYVHENIFEKYVEAFVEETKKLTIGDGLANPDVDLGPMVNKSGIETAITHIEDAVSKGAIIKCGGKRPKNKNLARGNFFEPTVLINVSINMKIMKEETFGPVVAIDTFSSTEEAINKANSTNYGLVSYLYTQNINTAFNVSEAIDSGSIGINTVSPDSIYAPYSGRKDSGYGVELSKYGMHQYLQFKHIKIELE
jgi:succinate-semialdehyde dehydrogenase/glutarate-semialdehyde dehydrogenase